MEDVKYWCKERKDLRHHLKVKVIISNSRSLSYIISHQVWSILISLGTEIYIVLGEHFTCINGLDAS